MRTNDLVLAFPALLLAIMFGAVYGPSTLTAMIAIGIATIPSFARLARGGALQVLATEYVLAARAAGPPAHRDRRPARAAEHRRAAASCRRRCRSRSRCSPRRRCRSSASAPAADAVVGPDAAGGAGAALPRRRALALWPGLAIALAVLGFNLLGDGLRDRFDPRLEDRR